MTIIGPRVNVDVGTNNVWVNGIGVLQMLTDSNMNGQKLAKPSELTVHWKESMLFNGKIAEFHGGVQADQLESRMLCQDLQVTFDRFISLKEGNKSQDKPKIDKLLCDKNVMVEEIVKENGKLKSFRRLVSPVVALDNLDETVNATGPGEVRLLQSGSEGEIGPKAPEPKTKQAKPPAGKAAPPKDEMKLTHVKFADRMQANNKKRTATFYGNIELVNLPADKPDIVIDLNKPPPGCMYVRCEKLNVFSHLLPNGQKSQELEAYRKVFVQSQDFYAVADAVKYNESQDRLIFEGGESGLATLYRIKVPGTKPEQMTGKKIYYWRKTNDIKVEEGQGLNFTN